MNLIRMVTDLTCKCYLTGMSRLYTKRKRGKEEKRKREEEKRSIRVEEKIQRKVKKRE